MLSKSKRYLNAPAGKKVFPQHLTVPGHFVLSTMCCLRPYSFFVSVPMTCLFLSDGLSNLSTVLKNWSFRSSMSVCLPSDVLYHILCHRSNLSPTTLREDCLISIFLEWHGQFSTFCNALQLYFVKCHFEIPLESGEFWFSVRTDSKLFPRRFAINNNSAELLRNKVESI